MFIDQKGCFFNIVELPRSICGSHVKSFQPATGSTRLGFLVSKEREGPFLSICEFFYLYGHTEAKPLSNSQEERSAFENKVTLTQDSVGKLGDLKDAQKLLFASSLEEVGRNSVEVVLLFPRIPEEARDVSWSPSRWSLLSVLKQSIVHGSHCPCS